MGGVLGDEDLRGIEDDVLEEPDGRHLTEVDVARKRPTERELKRETGSPDGAATGRAARDLPDALFFQPDRGGVLDHRTGTVCLFWSAEDRAGEAWADKAAYDRTAKELVSRFEANFESFSGGVSEAVLAAAIRAAA